MFIIYNTFCSSNKDGRFLQWTQLLTQPCQSITALASFTCAVTTVAPETWLTLAAVSIVTIAFQTVFKQTFHITLFSIVTRFADETVTRVFITGALTVWMALVLTMRSPGPGLAFGTGTCCSVTLP